MINIVGGWEIISYGRLIISGPPLYSEALMLIENQLHPYHCAYSYHYGFHISMSINTIMCKIIKLGHNFNFVNLAYLSDSDFFV